MKYYGQLTWDVGGHMECHFETKIGVVIFAYNLGKRMSIIYEIKVWQGLGHNIYQKYLRINSLYDLLFYTFTGKGDLGCPRKRWKNFNLEKGHNVSNVVYKLTFVTLLL